MRKSFDALGIVGKYLKKTEIAELRLNKWAEAKLANATFYQWIDTYNARVHYRQQYFKATQYWRIRS
jgi:hypothetical protein